MDLSVVYAKTPKGVRLRKSLFGGLPAHLMKIMALIDGKTSTQNILNQLDGFSEQKFIAAISQIENEGYIKIVEVIKQEDDWELDTFFSPMVVEEVYNVEEIDGTAELETYLELEQIAKKKEAERREDELKAREVEAQIRAKEIAKAEAKIRQKDAEEEAHRAQQAEIERQKAEAETRKQAEMKAKAQAKVDAQEKARLEAEHLAREAELARIRAEAEAAQAKAKLENERQERLAAEARAQAEKVVLETAEKERAIAEAKENAKRAAEEDARLAAARIAEKKAQAREQAEHAARQKAEHAAQALVERIREKERQRREETRKMKEAEEARMQVVLALQAKAQAEEADRLAEEKKTQEQQAAAEALAKAEEAARLEAEHQAKLAEEARLQAELAAKQEAERLQRIAEAEEVARVAAEEQAHLEAARIAQAAEEARLQAELEAQAQAEQAARLEADHQAKLAEEAQAQAEAAARLEAERQEKLAQEAQAQAEHAAKQEEERLQAIAAAEAQARLDAERMAREAEAAQKKAEADARALAEKEAKIEAERQARLIAEANAKEKAAAKEQAKLEKVRIAKEKTEREAQKKAEAKAQKEAERLAKKEKEVKQAAVKAEEQAAEKAAREEAKSLASEMMGHKPLRAKNSLLNVAKAKYRKFDILVLSRFKGANDNAKQPKKWLSGLLRFSLVYMPIALILLLGLMHFVPLNFLVAPIENFAAASIGAPVKVGEVRASLWPQPHFMLHHVMMGENPAIQLDSIKAAPQITSLLSEVKTLNSLLIEGVTLNQKDVAKPLQWLQAARLSPQLQVDDVRFSKVKLNIRDLTLVPFNGHVIPHHAGELGGIALKSEDGALAIEVQPQANQYRVKLAASKWTLPVGPNIVFEALHASGTYQQERLQLDQLQGEIYGGTFSAKAMVDWSNQWQTSGNFNLIKANAAQLLKAFSSTALVDGKLNLAGNFSAQSNIATQLLDDAEVTGNFNIPNGKINGVDLARAILNPEDKALEGYATNFDQLTGGVWAKGGRVEYRNLVLKSPKLQAQGQVQIAPSEAISGKISLNAVAQGRNFQSTFDLTGKVSNVKRY
ncbi:MAG: hypothetical protein CTY12_06445 [Methylotenera sp.]|nr:MAG: hypothetical protein CTY12_06445 [Methylotenera sp.]